MPEAQQLDPVTFEVFRSTFEYICERMTKVLQKASFSPIIYDMVDFSNAILDPKVQLVGQAANCPVHLAAMHFSANAAVFKYGQAGLKRGDVVILNDPYQGGTHTNDVTLTTPVYFRDTLIGFAVSRAHWTDVGGGGAGGQAFASHIAAEGLRLPPLKLCNEYRLDQDILQILKHASRTPQYVEGDIYAQLGALKAAEEELQRLAQRYGPETVIAATEAVIDYTERRTRAAIARIPDGVYEAEDYADTDGYSPNPVYIRLKLIVKGDTITVDLTGTDPEAVGGINSPLANTYSAVYYSLKFFLDPDAPANAGMYRPIRVVLPEGCWLNPRWPRPTIGCTTLASSKITAAIWQALAKAIPDQIVAPTFSECNWFVASVRDPKTGTVHVFSDLPAGGWGGTPHGDGMSVTMDPLGNCMNLSAEIAEMLFPIRYEAFDLVPDSAGPGLHRGGLGSRLQVRFLGSGELSMECSRTRAGTPGVNGGGASRPQRQLKVRADGTQEVIGGWAPDGWKSCLLASHPFAPNEAFRFEATGGGGWGDPLERDPERVLDDVLDEYVSVAAAREQYGVVITPAMTVDRDATRSLREQMRQQRRA